MTKRITTHLHLVTNLQSHEDDAVAQARKFAAYDPPLSPGYTQGALLAVDMIEDLQEAGESDRCSILSEFRPGEFQHDIVAQYLPQLIDPEVSRGFSSMLSYVLALALGSDGVVPFTDWLRVLAQKPPADAHVEWSRMNA